MPDKNTSTEIGFVLLQAQTPANAASQPQPNQQNWLRFFNPPQTHQARVRSAKSKSHPGGEWLRFFNLHQPPPSKLE